VFGAFSGLLVCEGLEVFPKGLSYQLINDGGSLINNSYLEDTRTHLLRDWFTFPHKWFDTF